MTNCLLELLKIYPDKPCDWNIIYKNPNIPWDFIKSYSSTTLDDFYDISIVTDN